jgi:hypothetical protein
MVPGKALNEVFKSALKSNNELGSKGVPLPKRRKGLPGL